MMGDHSLWRFPLVCQRIPDRAVSRLFGFALAATAAFGVAVCSVRGDDVDVQTDAEEAPANDEPTNGVADLLDVFGTVFTETPWWGWVALFLSILIGLIAGKIVQAFLRKAGVRWKENGAEIRGCFFDDMASPASLVLLTIGVTIGLRWIRMPAELNEFSWNVVTLLYLIAIGWFVFNLVDLVDVGLRRVTHADTNKLSAQLVPLIRKALRIFVLIVFALFIAQNIFGINVTAWLAGLGIAGLAVSLAAQDSIKNLFGSITVLLDKPFAVGDRIVFSSTDGFVEEIGFRSTKIRTFTGHLVTVPNMKFIDGDVENVSARPFIRRMLDVTITYDTPPEKVAEAVQIIKDILTEEEMVKPFRLEERPPRVFFNDYNAASLNISVAYWYFLDEAAGQDWWGFLAYNEAFNHKLLQAFNDAGIEFAFPTQTLYLAGDEKRELAVRVLGDSSNASSDGRTGPHGG
jgi:MscS family membrane protein